LQNAPEHFIGWACVFPILFQRLQPFGEDSFSVVIQFRLWVGARWLGAHLSNSIGSGFHCNPHQATKRAFADLHFKAAPKALPKRHKGEVGHAFSVIDHNAVPNQCG
jgi:hypothetical protein